MNIPGDRVYQKISNSQNICQTKPIFGEMDIRKKRLRTSKQNILNEKKKITFKTIFKIIMQIILQKSHVLLFVANNIKEILTTTDMKFEMKKQHK